MIIKKINLREGKNVTLTTYIQEPSHEMEPVQDKPGILILPGGGYQFCSDREAEPIALSYLKEGYNAFVLTYSLKEDSSFPNPLEDAEKALGMIRENAKEWHTIDNKIACIGFSAGGHLALSLGTSKVIRPNALILGYGAFIRAVEQQWDYPTPIIDKDVPETFLFHTYLDNVVPVDTSLFVAGELRKYDIPFELHVFRNGSHGLSLGNETVNWGNGFVSDKQYEKWLSLSVDWLNDLFKIY